MSKKSKIGLVALAVLVVLGGVYAYPAIEYQKNLADLEERCVDLTKNDSDGRVYEPIVGRFLGSKSDFFSVSGVKPMKVNVRLVLASDTSEQVVRYSALVGESEAVFQKIYSVIEKDVIAQRQDTSAQYGICACNEYSFYAGVLETLVKLKD